MIGAYFYNAKLLSSYFVNANKVQMVIGKDEMRFIDST